MGARVAGVSPGWYTMSRKCCFSCSVREAPSALPSIRHDDSSAHHLEMRRQARGENGVRASVVRGSPQGRTAVRREKPRGVRMMMEGGPGQSRAPADLRAAVLPPNSHLSLVSLPALNASSR